MKRIFAYFGVVCVWSTTPLGIQWSSEGVGFFVSVSARMCLAAMLVLPLAMLLDKRLPMSRSSVLSYASGSIGIFLAMMSTYWANQFVPSGLVSVLFGLTPLFTGFLAFGLLGEPFNSRKIMGVLVSVIGLAVIFYDSLYSDTIRLEALGMLLLAVLLFSLSTVLVKRVNAKVTPLQQTAGTLLVSALCYLVTWSLISPDVPSSISTRAALSLTYLVVICSVFGFLLFYYVLSTSSAGAVSLINLVTPVTALLLGVYLNGEYISVRVVIGALCIGLGLFVYQFGTIYRLIKNRARPMADTGYIDPYQGWAITKRKK